MKIAIIAITGNGARLGTELQKRLGNATLHVLPRYLPLAGAGALPLSVPLRDELPRLWRDADGLVLIMATGIVVRLVAPLLEGKDRDPAVVVIDDAGKFAISLLSGHLGGANELAGRCAFITGAREVITTATDANNLPSFDLLAKEQGWAIDDLSRVKVLNSLLLDGEAIAVVDGTGQVRPWFRGRGRLSFHDTFVAGLRSGAKGVLFVTNSLIPPQLQMENLLVLRPKNLALGIGCNSGTGVEEIEALIHEQMRLLALAPQSVGCIASAEAKRGEPGLMACAERLRVPLRFFSSEELNRVETPSPPSAHALKAIGAAGVAEPAALLASRGGRLLLNKVKSGNVTLAIAEMNE